MKLRTTIRAMLRRFLRRFGRHDTSEIERMKKVVRMVGATKDTEISCDEAYHLLDQYAEALLRGEDTDALFPEVKHHLELCMDCREELDALLEALRA